MINVIFAPVLWLPMALVEITLILLGWVLVPIMAALKRYTGALGKDGDGKPKTILLWRDRFMSPWQNFEDGIAGGAQYYAPDISIWKHIVLWSCNRNPANGLRWFKWSTVWWVPGEVKFRGSFKDEINRYDASSGPDHNAPQWFYAWRGCKSGFYWIREWPLFGLRRLWVGFSLYPADSVLPMRGYRKDGAAFKMQFKPLEKK